MTMMTDRELREGGSRRFNLIDLMIVVVAVAFTAWGWKTAWNFPIRRETTLYLAPGSGSLGLNPYLNIEKVGFEFVEVGMLAISLTLTVLRIRQPRPRLVRLMRQPGWVACLSASLASLMTVILEWSGHKIHNARGLFYATGSFGGMPNSRANSWFATVALASGIAVLIAWLFLALGGRWRGEASWIDRAGRVTGWIWLLLLAGYVARNYFP